jgi:hypothetical protein
MKRISLLLTLLLFTQAAYAFNTWHTDGTLEGVRLALVSAATGDTVIIGDTDPRTGLKSFTWDDTLTVTKNIKLLGEGMPGLGSTNTTQIVVGNNTAKNKLIYYTCDKLNLNTTAEVGNMELKGSSGDKLQVDGVAILQDGGGVGSCENSGNCKGGFRLHHVKFSVDYATNPSAQHHFSTRGWIMGVEDHCEIDDPLSNSANETQIFNHEASPDGSGIKGDYAWNFPTDGSEGAGRKDLFYGEDNIFHHSGVVLDSQSGLGGGGMVCFRHTLTWGQMSGHGVRESGAEQFGRRLGEFYNNIFVRDYTAPTAASQTYLSFGGAGGRSGEHVAYNNVTVLITNTSGAPNQAPLGWSTPSVCEQGTIPNYAAWGYGTDGMGPFDENQTADGGSDGTGAWVTVQKAGSATSTHYRDVAYNYPVASHPAGATLGVVNVTGTDDVTAGVDTKDSRFGDVFGHANAASPAPTPTVNNNIVNGVDIQVVTGPKVAPQDTQVDDYWRGFVIRDAEVSRTQQKPRSWGLIMSSHYDANTHRTNLVLFPYNPCTNSPVDLSLSAHMELRKVKTYFGTFGAGQTNVLVHTSTNPYIKTYVSGSPNPRWTGQLAPGSWDWGNLYRLCTSVSGQCMTPPAGTVPAVWKNVPNNGRTAPGGDYELSARNYHQLNNNGTGAAVPASAYPAAGAIIPSYPYNPNATGPSARIGPDWVATFGDGSSNTGNFGTITSQANANSPGKGTGGWIYPHPLVASSVVANTINVSGPTSIVSPNTATYVITDSTNAVSDVTVNYTYSGTAVAGTDYTAPTSPATITAGTNSTTVNIPIISVPGRADKTATFTITGVSVGNTLGNSTSVTTTIRHPVTLTASVASNSVTEGSSVIYTINANGNVSSNLSVPFTMSGTAVSGTNYTALSSPATIASGANHVDITMNTINVTGIQPNHTATLGITASPTTAYYLGTPSSATTTINEAGGPTPTPTPAPTPPAIMVISP